MRTVPLPSSYRDPASFVFKDNDVIYRQINLAAKEEYDLFHVSGLYDKLVKNNLLIPIEQGNILTTFLMKVGAAFFMNAAFLV